MLAPDRQDDAWRRAVGDRHKDGRRLAGVRRAFDEVTGQQAIARRQGEGSAQAVD
jgi:hypothetical protein